MTNQAEKPPLTREELRQMSHDEIIAYDPNRYRLSQNDTIHEQTTGKIVKGQRIPNFTDPEKTRHAHQRRKELAIQAALDGIQDATATNTPADAWRKIIEARTRAALDPDNSQGNAAARLVGEAAAIISPKDAQDQSRQGINLNIDAETAARILRSIEEIAQSRRDEAAKSDPLLN